MTPKRGGEGKSEIFPWSRGWWTGNLQRTIEFVPIFQNKNVPAVLQSDLHCSSPVTHASRHAFLSESARQPRSARLLLHGHSSTYPGCCKCQVYGGITKQSIANVHAKDFDKLLPSIISFPQCGYHPPVPQNPPKESSWGSMESQILWQDIAETWKKK